MDDAQFQNWMKRMAAMEGRTDPPSTGAVWWRAQLRRRMADEERAIRPIRIAEGAAGISGWLLAAFVSTSLGPGALVAFLAISVAIVGGLGAITLKRT
jgi:hypothetical protein